MALNKLKRIKNELKQNAETYDEAFKNTAFIAAEGLSNQQKSLNNKILVQKLDKQYFINQYGNLKTAKEEYKRVYGNNNYGKSWDDFINAVQELPLLQKSGLTLEQRIERIENILRIMGQEL